MSLDGVRKFVAQKLQSLSPLTGAATIFALALLSSGQSASLVATVAGQMVSEGFLRWRVSVSVISSERLHFLMQPIQLST